MVRHSVVLVHLQLVLLQRQRVIRKHFITWIVRFNFFQNFYTAPAAFSGFGTGLSGFGAQSAAPSFSFNTPSFGATTQAQSGFGGFGSSNFKTFSNLILN